jgi:hypothetical protein
MLQGHKLFFYCDRFNQYESSMIEELNKHPMKKCRNELAHHCDSCTKTLQGRIRLLRYWINIASHSWLANIASQSRTGNRAQHANQQTKLTHIHCDILKFKASIHTNRATVEIHEARNMCDTERTTAMQCQMHNEPELKYSKHAIS